MITYRIDKGSPLSIEELDENFRTLEAKIENIEECLEPIKLCTEQIGNTVIIKNHGEEIGNFNIPKSTISFKGKWQEKNYYEADDLVVHLECLYTCKLSHLSEKIFSNDNWTKIFEGKI